MSQNKLRPDGYGARVFNFIAKCLWSIVWLGRWTIRLLKGIFLPKSEYNNLQMMIAGGAFFA